MKKYCLFFLFLVMPACTSDGQQRLKIPRAKAVTCLRPPALSLQAQLLTNPLPLLGRYLIPKFIIRILLTDEETELRGKKVVTHGLISHQRLSP